MTKKVWMLAATLVASIATAPVHASEGDVCKKVTLGDVGWSDIAATTGVAMMLLDGLGYETSKTIASPPIVLAGVKKAQIDAFLGYWDPSMTPTVKPFVDAGAFFMNKSPWRACSNAKRTNATLSRSGIRKRVISGSVTVIGCPALICAAHAFRCRSTCRYSASTASRWANCLRRRSRASVRRIAASAARPGTG